MATSYDYLKKSQTPSQYRTTNKVYGYSSPTIDWGNRVHSNYVKFGDLYKNWEINRDQTVDYRNQLKKEYAANPIGSKTTRHAQYLPGRGGSGLNDAESKRFDEYYKLSVMPMVESREAQRMFGGSSVRPTTLAAWQAYDENMGMAAIANRGGVGYGSGQADDNLYRYMTGGASNLYGDIETKPYAEVKKELIDGLNVSKWRDVVKSAMFKGTSAVDESLAGISQGVFNSVDQVKPRLPRGVSDRQLQDRTRSGRSR